MNAGQFPQKIGSLALLCFTPLFISLPFVWYFKFPLNERLNGRFMYIRTGVA